MLNDRWFSMRSLHVGKQFAQYRESPKIIYVHVHWIWSGRHTHTHKYTRTTHTKNHVDVKSKNQKSTSNFVSRYFFLFFCTYFAKKWHRFTAKYVRLLIFAFDMSFIISLRNWYATVSTSFPQNKIRMEKRTRTTDRQAFSQSGSLASGRTGIQHIVSSEYEFY